MKNRVPSCLPSCADWLQSAGLNRPITKRLPSTKCQHRLRLLTQTRKKNTQRNQSRKKKNTPWERNTRKWNNPPRNTNVPSKTLKNREMLQRNPILFGASDIVPTPISAMVIVHLVTVVTGTTTTNQPPMMSTMSTTLKNKPSRLNSALGNSVSDQNAEITQGIHSRHVTERNPDARFALVATDKKWIHSAPVTPRNQVEESAWQTTRWIQSGCATNRDPAEEFASVTTAKKWTRGGVVGGQQGDNCDAVEARPWIPYV